MGLGTSAGLTLSPLPWKLLDDLSIWTQNWPWVPVPKNGEVSQLDSVCTLCPGGCGITIRKVDERVVAVAGREDSPINKGGICPLGLSGPQLLYTPVRVMSPLLRVNGSFEPISWAKAMSILASRLNELRDSRNPQKLACLADTGKGTGPQLLKRFLAAFGSTNFFYTPSAEDIWEVLAEKLTGRRFVPGYDLEAADTILSFGCGLVEGWGNPVRSMSAHSLWKESGATLVQIEPRLSNTAAVADRWIAVKPGSETDLALGICRAIVEKYPVHRQRLANNVENWFSFQNVLKNSFSLAQVKKATDLSGAVIESLADEFANSERPLAISGRGQGRSPGEAGELQAVLALNILAGNIDQPGGFHCMKRQDHINWPDVTPDNLPTSGSSPEDLFQSVADGSSPPVEMLLVSGTNPCYALMDSDMVNEAFQQIPFVVSFTAYWDETAVNADLVLPNHSHLERYQDFPIYNGLTKPKLGLSKPVSRKLFDTRYTGDVVIEMAKNLGGSVGKAFAWRNYESCLKDTLADRWQPMIEKGYIDIPQRSDKSRPPFKLVGFENEQIKLAGDQREYPLIMIPKASMRLNSGVVGSPPFMVKTVEDTVLRKNLGVVDLHPQTAGALNLSEGDTARLTTPNGKADVSIHLEEGIIPGLVAISQGLGHSAFDGYLAEKGVNINRLLGPTKDPITGHNATWGTRAKLEQV